LAFAADIPSIAIAKVSLYDKTEQLVGSRGIRLGLLDLKVDMPAIVEESFNPVTVSMIPPYPLATMRILPTGTGFLSDDTTVTLAGKLVVDGESYIELPTLQYPDEDVIYVESNPDQIQVEIGVIEPSTAWKARHALTLINSSSCSFVGEMTVQMHDTSEIEMSKEVDSFIVRETDLGTLVGSTFKSATTIDTEDELIAQVLVKDEPDVEEPGSFTYNLISSGNSPSSEYPDDSIEIEVYKVATSNIPGYHIYRSFDSDHQVYIVPTVYKTPSDAEDMPYQFIYIDKNGGTLELEPANP
jgi:hypothetical protein